MRDRPDGHDDAVDTKAVWAGEERYLLDRATQVPVVHSVAFGYDDVDEWQAVATGKAPGHIYGRNTNPTVAVFEEKLRVLEGGEAATSAATGMAAISNTLYALLAPGQRDCAQRFRLVHLAIAHKGPDFALFRIENAAMVQIAHKAGLVDCCDRP